MTSAPANKGSCIKTSILPHQLATALDQAPADLEMLSLDCLDTLLWRNIHAPAHVFADLGKAGPTSQQRIWAESHARSRMALHNRSNEATIEQIYDALLPDQPETMVSQGVAAELESEARHCFAFAPTVQLMRVARERGLRIAIVSDTYLSQEQLRALIAAVAGDEVVALVDDMFCSSEFGVSKSEGLFEHVLRNTDVAPARILHIGDNKKADLTPAQKLGINALHLVQFSAAEQQRLRLEAAVDAIVNTSGPAQTPCYQPHRALTALVGPTLDDPAEALGHSTLGPVLHTSARWIADEAASLSRPGARTHLLFLMRDGHLPKRVC